MLPIDLEVTALIGMMITMTTMIVMTATIMTTTDRMMVMTMMVLLVTIFVFMKEELLKVSVLQCYSIYSEPID